MKFLFPLGRLLFSLIFITAAPRHFTPEGIQHAAALGVPAAGALVPLSGVLALAGGVSVAASAYKTRWGAWILAAFLVPVTWWMHGYWRLQRSDGNSYSTGDVCKEPLHAGSGAADFAIWRRPGESRREERTAQ